MSSRMKRNLYALKMLSKAPKHIRHAILNNASRDLILALDEVIHNVMLGSVDFNRKDLKKLKKQKNRIGRIWDEDTPLKMKKQLLKQNGGFLPTMLPPVLALLSTILSSI